MTPSHEMALNKMTLEMALEMALDLEHGLSDRHAESPRRV